MIRSTATGVELDVRVVPRAGRSGLAGTRDGRLLVRLTAPPVEGAANEALIQLLADLLDRPRSSVQITSGEKSRMKRVGVDGVTVAEANARLGL